MTVIGIIFQNFIFRLTPFSLELTPDPHSTLQNPQFSSFKRSEQKKERKFDFHPTKCFTFHCIRWNHHALSASVEAPFSNLIDHHQENSDWTNLAQIARHNFLIFLHWKTLFQKSNFLKWEKRNKLCNDDHGDDNWIDYGMWERASTTVPHRPTKYLLLLFLTTGWILLLIASAERCHCGRFSHPPPHTTVDRPWAWREQTTSEVLLSITFSPTWIFLRTQPDVYGYATFLEVCWC